MNVQSIVSAAALAAAPTPAKLTLFVSVSTVAATASPAPLTHEIDSSVHSSEGSAGVTSASVMVKSECPTRNARYEAMDARFDSPRPEGVSVWLKAPSSTQPDTAVPSEVVDEAVAPAGASLASLVAVEVKATEGWVAPALAPSISVTLWMRT